MEKDETPAVAQPSAPVNAAAGTVLPHPPEVIFAKLKADNEPIVVESMCTNCEENGKTTMLLTNIPFFKEVILISFCCDNCGNKNSEIQFGGKLAPEGVKIVFSGTNAKDLGRDIVKSEFAKIMIPELEFEIPSNKKGEVTTLEGLFTRCIEDLEAEQPTRKYMEPELYNKIQDFLVKLEDLKNGNRLPFTVIIDDPSGNSFIKNPLAPKLDPRLHFNYYKRTTKMIQDMGYSVENAQKECQDLEKQEWKDAQNDPTQEPRENAHKVDFTKPFNEDNFMKTEAASFSVPCHSCGLPGETKMCETSIPYFSDIIIMSFHCDYCGVHSTETKTAGGVKDKGAKITLKNPNAEDLKRDLFKSESCAVNIPELELELDYGTLGGCLTTVEGLLEKISTHLCENNPFADSDSEFSKRMDQLFENLKKCREGNMPFTLILIDPLGHSFMQNPRYPDPDPGVVVELFERTQDQNEFLGLLDMNVDDYQKK